MTKSEAVELVNELIAKIREASLKEAAAMFPASRKNPFTELAKECVEVKSKIERSNEEIIPVTVNDEDAENVIHNLNIRFAGLRRRGKLVILGASIIAFVVTAVLLSVFGADAQAWVEDNFNVQGALKFVLLGVAGAIVFVVTEGLTKQNKLTEEAPELTFRRIIAHLSFAVIIPIVIIVVFFNFPKSGKPDLKANTPELLSFAAGYSSKLVILFLNKVVEKGETIIKAL